MENFVVSPNYVNRSAEKKWLVRKSEESVENLIAHSFVKATNVLFKTSGEIEEGFGCNMVAICESAETSEDPSRNLLNISKLVELGFNISNANGFYNKDTHAEVTGVKELYLHPDGKMFAKLF